MLKLFKTESKFSWIVLIFIGMIILQSNPSNAACRIGGWTHNASGVGNFEASFVVGWCQNADEIINFTKPAGELWLFSFGGPFANCNDYCGNVWINATNYSLGIYGYTDNGYPLNSSNVAGWSSSTTKYINVTMNLTLTPTISNVTDQGTSGTSTTITWLTDYNSNSTVNYGTTLALSNKATNSSTGTDHFVSLTGLSPGVLYYYNVTSCTSDNTCTSSGTYNFTTTDTAPPLYSNIVEPTDPSTYNVTKVYWFNATWTDPTGVSEVILTFNGTNYSYAKGELLKTGNVYSFNVTGLAVGTYAYRWWANDSDNNWNSTTQYTFTVTKVSTSINLLLNGKDTNIYPAPGSTVNITAYLSPSTAGNVYLYVNGTLLNSGTSPVSNTTTSFGVGLFNITAYYPGNQNYSSSYETHFINVTQYFVNLTLLHEKNYTLNITFYEAGSNTVVNSSFGTVGNKTFTLFGTGVYDILFKPLNFSFEIKLFNAVLSSTETFGLDMLSTAITGYLATYGVNSSIQMDNATLTFNYTDIGYSNEDYLELYKCDQWNFYSETCSGSWSQLSPAQDKTLNTLTVTVTSFSGFSIKQGSAPTTSSSSGGAGGEAGGGGGGTTRTCEENWTCTDWSECIDGERTRVCSDLNACNTTENKPKEKESCEAPVEEEVKEEKEEKKVQEEKKPAKKPAKKVDRKKYLKYGILLLILAGILTLAYFKRKSIFALFKPKPVKRVKKIKRFKPKKQDTIFKDIEDIIRKEKKR